MSNLSVHPTALVDASARLGDGCVVWAFASIGRLARLGEGCRVGQGVYIDREVIIGNHAWIHTNASIYRPVQLGDHVFVGPSVVFVNDPDPRSDTTRCVSDLGWKIHDFATIGANATILCDIDVAPYTLIGAGAVVTKATAPYGIYTGVPARLVGYRCKCLRRFPAMPKPQGCSECGAVFQ